MDYGTRIKQIRERVGMTQAELSAKSGISQEHISRIENNHFTPTIKTADKICDAMGVTLNELFIESEDQ